MRLTLLIIALACTQAYTPKWLSNIYRDDSTVLPIEFDDSYHNLGYQHFVYSSNADAVKYMNIHSKDAGGAFYSLNKFSGESPYEFSNRLMLTPNTTLHSQIPLAKDLPTDDLPESFDWREKGAVTPVKNQEQCGSCWAFSTTGDIEGSWFLSGNQLTSLSEQDLVDCDHNGDQGCNGGLPSQAMQYVINAGGIESEKAYPYYASDQQCKYNSKVPTKKVAATISSYERVSQDEDQMAAYLVKNGPLSIGINAQWMQFYNSGISNPKVCNPAGLDHGVLIVGYGVENSTKFWIIKNSWGEDWGEQGYYRIVRGVGKCGLNRMVVHSVV